MFYAVDIISWYITKCTVLHALFKPIKSEHKRTMNKNVSNEESRRPRNPVADASFLCKHSFWWVRCVCVLNSVCVVDVAVPKIRSTQKTRANHVVCCMLCVPVRISMAQTKLWKCAKHAATLHGFVNLFTNKVSRILTVKCSSTFQLSMNLMKTNSHYSKNKLCITVNTRASCNAHNFTYAFGPELVCCIN